MRLQLFEHNQAAFDTALEMLKATGNQKMVKGKPAALYSFNPMYQYLEENL